MKEQVYMYWQIALTVVGAAGSIASIIALVQAMRVVSALREQQRSFTRQAVLPKYINNLEGFLSNLEQARTLKIVSDIRKSAAHCRAMLQSLEPFVDKPVAVQMRLVTVALSDILAADYAGSLFVDVETVISDLHGVLRSVQNIELELPWRRRDA